MLRPTILSEENSTEEILRDARYHHAALLADPQTADLAPAVKTRSAALRAAAAATAEAEELRQEKQALRDRAEYVHDDRQRALEIEVLGAVKKNRAAPAYREVYRKGFTVLISLSREEQKREVKVQLKGLEMALPALAKKYKKELAELAGACTAAQKALADAVTEAAEAFGAEILARGERARQMRRNEGALISLVPDDKGRVRLYFRDRRRAPKKSEPA